MVWVHLVPSPLVYFLFCYIYYWVSFATFSFLNRTVGFEHHLKCGALEWIEFVSISWSFPEKINLRSFFSRCHMWKGWACDSCGKIWEWGQWKCTILYVRSHTLVDAYVLWCWKNRAKWNNAHRLHQIWQPPEYIQKSMEKKRWLNLKTSCE